MNFFRRAILLAVLVGSVASALAIDPAKVVIIKTDDFKTPNQAWTNFLNVSRAAGIKVSIGVIVSNIVGKAATTQWIQSQQNRGDVEFWNHGWHHTRWTAANGQTVSEYEGVTQTSMFQNLTNAQAKLKLATGRDILSLGTPYNGFDANTAAAVNAIPEFRLFFSDDVPFARAHLDPRVHVVPLIREHDGTGIPNATKFQTDFPPGTPGPVSLQFHPPNFTAASIIEYQKIVQYLLTNDYTILMPSEYIAMQPPQLVRSTRLSSELELVWRGGVNSACTLFTATNPATPTELIWTPVATNQVGLSGLSTNRLTITSGNIQRFYRLSIPGI